MDEPQVEDLTLTSTIKKLRPMRQNDSAIPKESLPFSGKFHGSLAPAVALDDLRIDSFLLSRLQTRLPAEEIFFTAVWSTDETTGVGSP